MEKIRVGLVTSVIDGRRGRGTALVARKFLEQLDRFKGRYDFTLIHGKPDDDPLYANYPEIVMPPCPLPFAKQFLSECIFWLKHRLTKKRFDVVHYLHHRVWPSYLLAAGKKVVVTVYDAGVMLDLNAPSIGDRIFRFTNRFLHQRMHTIITSSEFGKREIMEHYRVQEERVHVVPLGVDPIFRPVAMGQEHRDMLRTYGIRQPYILSVSRFDPHKNILRLIDAYALFRKKSHAAQLVLVGGRHMVNYSREVDARIRDSGFADSIHIAPYIPDSDMPLVYSAAQMLIYSSLHEGFGLPIVEAFACGTPVTTSNSTACVETAGGAARLFDPVNTSAIAQAMLDVCTDEALRAKLREKGLARAKEFSWEKTAETTCKLYEQIAKD